MPLIDNAPLFIVIDGIDGCGKSTQIRKLRKLFEHNGLQTIQTKEPGGTKAGVLFRKILISTEYEIEHETEMLLYCADRLEHQKKVVIPALKNNKNVLCDRFLPSTFAYQVFGRQLKDDLLNMLIPVSVFKWPDITFIIDIEPETALERAINRLKRQNEIETEGKFEQLGIDFFGKVRKGFLWYAEKHDNVIVIDGNCGIDEVFEQIRENIFGEMQ